MLRELVQGRGCDAGPSGSGNALSGLSQGLLYGASSKSLQAPLDIPADRARSLDAASSSKVRSRTAVVARHFSADLGIRHDRLPVAKGTDDAKLSAFLPTSQQGEVIGRCCVSVDRLRTRGSEEEGWKA